MRPKTLITMAVTGMLAVPGLPALAADWSFQQLQVTDGYDAVQNYSPPPDRGAAGDASPEKILQVKTGLYDRGVIESK